MKENYVCKSLETHLFFGRIMKEHAFFLKAGFTPANPDFSKRAEYFKTEFERLLNDAVMLSNCNIGESVINSGEIVTEFTLNAERQSERFTGIALNRNITQKEIQLKSGCECAPRNNLYMRVKQLNARSLELLKGLIDFKEKILQNVLNCNMFTANYPLLIEHIIREAKQYQKYIKMLENGEYLQDDIMLQNECFWNRIMMEHALFIRGLLDPAEAELIDTANGFAEDYKALLDKCRNMQESAYKAESLSETLKLKDFKTAGVRGIEQCRIRSVILPLLADHVLREANHYIRLLNA